MPVMIIHIALAAIAVGLLILVHELGHFLAAKAVGVRVETFSIGFWKKIAGFRKGSTEYRLSLIPLGGYVKMAGEMHGEGEGKPDEFCSKSPGKRALILVSGVAMNVLFALLAFIIAFTIGVPFEVAEVGALEKDSPAWKAGLLPGDRIIAVNKTEDPDFQDLQRHVALKRDDSIEIKVERGSERLTFRLKPRYEPAAGMRLIGFSPPVEPVVTGLFKMGTDNGRSPALEAGMEINDRVISVNGRPVNYFREILRELSLHREGEIELELQRNGEILRVNLDPLRSGRPMIGISGINTVIISLQGGGPASRAGLRPGDRIAAVEGDNVRSLIELENALENHRDGKAGLTVERAGETQEIEIDIAGRYGLKDFLFSFSTESSNKLTWVRERSPAWESGLRAGDTITEVGSREVLSWEDILDANARAGSEQRNITWERNGELLQSMVTPEIRKEDAQAQIGAVFNKTKVRITRKGMAGAVFLGMQKTYGAFADMVLTIRGFATRDVSTQHVGGIVLIAYASYHAATRGMGQLLYFSAIISAALAFLNILPIPVLDGGHLMFTGIEKLRGKAVSQKTQGISQAIGLSLLLLLVAYAIRNDILRFIS